MIKGSYKLAAKLWKVDEEIERGDDSVDLLRGAAERLEELAGTLADLSRDAKHRDAINGADWRRALKLFEALESGVDTSHGDASKLKTLLLLKVTFAEPEAPEEPKPKKKKKPGEPR